MLNGKSDHFTANDDEVMLVIVIFQEGTICAERNKQVMLCYAEYISKIVGGQGIYCNKIFNSS